MLRYICFLQPLSCSFLFVHQNGYFHGLILACKFCWTFCPALIFFCQTFIKNVRLSDRSDVFRQHCAWRYILTKWMEKCIMHVISVPIRGGMMFYRLKMGEGQLRPYKKKILVLRHRRALKIPPDETFLSWEGKKIAAAGQISHADK